MKKISLIYLLCILPGAQSSAAGQTVSKCFRADWLQGERVVKLTMDGNKVTGTFAVGDGGGVPPGATYSFSGTRRGSALTVAFAGNKLPDVAPSEMKSLVWTLAQAGGKESLRIKFSGKNYDTNKYEDSYADFESCGVGSGDAAASEPAKASYEDLVKTAQTIRFAKGKSSATVRLDKHAGLQAMSAPATFLINAAKSQELEVTAHGCNIEIYLPNRKRHSFVEWEAGDEKTYINSELDMASIEALPLTGNYLIVLRKAHESMEPDALTVTIKNRRRPKN
jgi:hypothetical protein